MSYDSQPSRLMAHPDIVVHVNVGLFLDITNRGITQYHC